MKFNISQSLGAYFSFITISEFSYEQLNSTFENQINLVFA